jgi:hypothetical protein
MNLLIFTHARPQGLPRVILDPEACICGRYYRNWREGGRWRFLNTPSGGFDLTPLLAKLPPSQQPEMILVHVDAAMGCLPHNIPKNVRRILLVGDTHHLERPLQSIIAYAASESFDSVFVWNRHNAHFFKQCGFSKVFWMPGLLFPVPPMVPTWERTDQICFFGQMGELHPRRNRILEDLKKQAMPLVVGCFPRSESLELAARSLVSLNITLNGEWNLRVFESTVMGALLLTDRLAPHTGLHHFYQEGHSMLCFSDSEDLIQTMHAIQRNKTEAARIAINGQRITNQHFSFEARRDTFFSLLHDQEAPEAFRLLDEPRCQLPAVEADRQGGLILRLQCYELLQELHRTFESVQVNLTSGVHPLLLSDAGDLIRLRQTLFIELETYHSHWREAMKELGVINLDALPFEAVAKARGDVLITCLADLQTVGVQQVLLTKNHPYLLLSDWFTDQDPRCEETLRALGYSPANHKVAGLFQVAGQETIAAATAGGGSSE